MRRSWLVLGVVLTLVLTGCSQLEDDSQSDPDESVTPAPVPAVEESDVSRFNISEITDGSTVSPTEISRAHLDALSNQSVRIHERRNWTTTGVEVRDRTVLLEKTAFLTASGEYRHNASHLTRFHQTDERRNTTVAVFRNESDQFRFTTTSDNETYERGGQPRQSTAKLLNMSGFIRQSLSVESASVERTTWRGETHYLIEGEEAAGGSYSLTESFDVRAIVQGDGLVRQLSVNYTESPMGQDRFVDYTITIDPIDRERLDAPEWVAQARNETD